MSSAPSTLAELHDRPEVFARLHELDDAGGELSLQKRLREEFPDELVRAALTLRDLRRKARAKFSRADAMWFDRVGLEQATPEPVAAHLARRFHGDVLDACCGIGGAAVALAAAGCRVTAVDDDPLRCWCAERNAEAHDVAPLVTVVRADVETLADRTRLLHVDPDRRTGGRRRTLRLEEGVPNLDTLRRWSEEFPGGAIELGPATNFPDKFPGREIELVSLRGECKVAVVWFGSLRTETDWRATLLPGGESLTGDPWTAMPEQGPVDRFLHDPDPSVVRAGLVDVLAEHANLTRLDAEEEYLTSSVATPSPFVRSFEVLEVVPNNAREIRRAVRAAGFAHVEIKCRHVKVDVEATRRKLPLEGTEPGVLIVARVGGRTRAVICRRVAESG